MRLGWVRKGEIKNHQLHKTAPWLNLCSVICQSGKISVSLLFLSRCCLSHQGNIPASATMEVITTIL